jgi:hypothetical protein
MGNPPVDITYLSNSGKPGSMTQNLTGYLSLFLVMLTSLELLTDRSWRRMIVALAVQFLAVFLLTLQSWSMGLSAVKLVAGWMALAILSASQPSGEIADTGDAPRGRFFRLAAAILIWSLVISVTPSIQGWLPLPSSLIWSGMILLGMGLLQLGMSDQPLRIIVGLLTLLSGFEVLYAAIENSVLVAGLLAVVTLGIASVGAYLIVVPTMEEQE